jgi:hypothetical protein
VYLIKFSDNAFLANKYSTARTVTKRVAFPVMMEELHFRENA